MGPVARRQARRDPAGTGRELGAGRERQDQMDLPSSPRGEIPRWQRVQRRCGDLEPRSLFQGRRTAIRSDRSGHRARPQSLAHRLSQDRRSDHRARQSAPAELFSWRPRLHALFEPGAVQKTRLMGGVRQGAVGHRPVQDHRVQAARQRHAEPQRGLLGAEAGPQARQDGAVPDAGADHPARCAALRSGRLDRGAAARRGAQPQGGGFRDRHQQLPPRLASIATGSSPC